MNTFQEFLEKQAQQSRAKERRERREEWIAAVGRLIDQIRDWLKQSDPAGVLDVFPIEIERAEPDLGAYSIRSLNVNLGYRSVQILPIGRDALGFLHPRSGPEMRAAGRVDITDGVRKYILYRVLNEGQEQWFSLDERLQPAPLDKARLEGILQDLLS